MTGTFTQRGRNSNSISIAATKVSELVSKGESIDVLVIGPGAVLNTAMLAEKPGVIPGKFQKKVESLVRKLPLPVRLYASFECLEIVDALKAADLKPRLTILDRSGRVLDIAGRSVESLAPDLVQSTLNRRVPDLSRRFALVVCCNVLYHIPDRDAWLKSRENILDYCAGDSVVVCDDGRIFLDTDFTEEESDVFVRTDVWRRDNLSCRQAESNTRPYGAKSKRVIAQWVVPTGRGAY